MNLLILFLLIIGSFAASATPITVPNYSFKSPSIPAQSYYDSTIIPDWIFATDDSAEFGTQYISFYFRSAGTASGNSFAFLDNNRAHTTETITSAASLATIAPSTQYTLTVAIGNASANHPSMGPVAFSLLADGTTLATQELSDGAVPSGIFGNFTLVYDSPASGSVIGENLTIQLQSLAQSGGDYMAAFSNVRLDAESLGIPAAPEPYGPSLSMVTLVAFALCRLLRQQLVTHTNAIT